MIKVEHVRQALNEASSPEERKDFAKGDKVVHKVEDQWHYPIATKYGFKPVDKEKTGFVRSYKYEHPTVKGTLTGNTGASADYFTLNSELGYHGDLEDFLSKATTVKDKSTNEGAERIPAFKDIETLKQYMRDTAEGGKVYGEDAHSEMQYGMWKNVKPEGWTGDSFPEEDLVMFDYMSYDVYPGEEGLDTLLGAWGEDEQEILDSANSYYFNTDAEGAHPNESAPTDVSTIDVDKVEPEQKDIDRAEGMTWGGRGRSTFYGSGAPFSSNAKKMAAAIKDPLKLVRRAKAVVARFGTRDHAGYSGGKHVESGQVWEPFKDALYAMGFTSSQVDKIAQTPRKR